MRVHYQAERMESGRANHYPTLHQTTPAVLLIHNYPAANVESLSSPPFCHGHQSGKTDLRLALPDLQADCMSKISLILKVTSLKTNAYVKRFHMSSIMKMPFSWSQSRWNPWLADSM